MATTKADVADGTATKGGVFFPELIPSIERTLAYVCLITDCGTFGLIRCFCLPSVVLFLSFAVAVYSRNLRMLTNNPPHT